MAAELINGSSELFVVVSVARAIDVENPSLTFMAYSLYPIVRFG